MKLKQSIKRLNPSIAVLVFCLGIVITCPLRIAQMLSIVQPDTGFFVKDASPVFVYGLYAVLALAGILIFLISFLSGKMPASELPQGKHPLLSVAALICACAYVYDAVSGYAGVVQNTATIVQNSNVRTILSHVEAVFALLSAVYFVLIFVAYISGKSILGKVRLLALAPLAWAVVSVLSRLVITIGYFKVSELFFELAGLVFLMIFFIAFARVASGIVPEGAMWRVIASGLAAALVLMTYAVPRLMLLITHHEDRLVSGYPIDWLDYALILFIIVAIFTILRHVRIDTPVQEAAEDRPSVVTTADSANVKKVDGPVPTPAEQDVPSEE